MNDSSAASYPDSPEAAAPGHLPRAYIEVIPGPDGPWFNSNDVCDALGIPLTSSSWMPFEMARKLTGMEGRKVQAVNPLGLFALCAKAGRSSSAPEPDSVRFLRPDHVEFDELERHQMSAARALLEALMVAYPQKPRGTARNKTGQISEGVSDQSRT